MTDGGSRDDRSSDVCWDSVSIEHPTPQQDKDIKHNGNLTLDEVIEVARTMRSRSCAKDLSGTVREMLGTAVSVGCTVDREDPRVIQQKVCVMWGAHRGGIDQDAT